jgi:hypothetical protein
MNIPEFLGLNVIMIGVLVLVVLVYLVVLIRKRRAQRFMHKNQ